MKKYIELIRLRNTCTFLFLAIPNVSVATDTSGDVMITWIGQELKISATSDPNVFGFMSIDDITNTGPTGYADASSLRTHDPNDFGDWPSVLIDIFGPAPTY